jgi:hypothetical protein
VFRECAGKQLSFPKGYNSGGVISVMSSAIQTLTGDPREPRGGAEVR